MTKYYALWYYSYCDGARGAFAISEHPEMLIKLHEENIKNPESQWYNYDEKLYEMKIEPSPTPLFIPERIYMYNIFISTVKNIIYYKGK